VSFLEFKLVSKESGPEIARLRLFFRHRFAHPALALRILGASLFVAAYV